MIYSKYILFEEIFMKRFLCAVCFLLLTAALTDSAFAQDSIYPSDKTNTQDNKPKDELFGKIAKLTQTKKAEDTEKAYQLGKDFVAKYGKDNDEKAKKIKDFVDKYRLSAFDKKLNENKTAEGFALGKEILAQEPENSYVTMNLAYGGYDALIKSKDKTFADESVKYAKQTLSLFEAGKLPKTFQPFKDQAEVTALMYYVIGSFLLDANLKEAAQNFYKSIQYEAQFKKNSYPYYVISFYYEKEYEKAAAAYQTKHGSKTTEDAEMKADQAKLEKLIDRMLDAYARAIKFGEAEKNASTDAWKKRFTDIYKFRHQNETGMTEYLGKVSDTPLPDPNSL